jgi:MFS family permease
MKLDYKKTFLIGFGFFATSIAWSIYNSYVPLLLGNFITSTAVIGFIMTIDNIFAVAFQPVFGALSDHTRTRFGRRMPYILLGIPICAVLFAFVPTMSFTLFWLIATIIVFNFIMSTWRAPVVALMPDVVPSQHRSRANGIINLMGGLGSLIAFAVGGWIYQKAGYNGPFVLTAAVMIAAVLVLFFFVKEPTAQEYTETVKEKKEKLNLSRGEIVSLLLILFAIFFWFTGYNAIETFFTLYATHTLPAAHGGFINSGSATMLLAFFSVSFIAAAFPAGMLGGKIGRKKTIIIGLIGVAVLFVPMYFVRNLWVLRGLLLVGGVFWAFVNINSLPMVVELAGSARVGTFTGFYYFFSSASAIVSPVLFGFIRDKTDNYPLMFLYAAVAYIIALACILFVKHGEVSQAKIGAIEAVGMADD